MAKTYNLTLQLNLRGPSNLGQVTSQLRKQLASASGSLKVGIDRKSLSSIDTATNKLKAMSSVLLEAQRASSTLNRNLDRLSKGFDKVRKSTAASNRTLSQATASVTAIGANLDKAGKKASKFDSIMSGSFGSVVKISAINKAVNLTTTAIDDAVRAAINFDRQMNKLQQLSRASAGAINYLGNEIRSLSTNLGVSSSELAQVAVTFAQTGQTGRQLADSLKAVAQASLAPTFTNMADAAEGAIAIMSQFNIKSNEMVRAFDSINTVASKFAVEFDDIITAVQKGGGAFAVASREIDSGSESLNKFVALFTAARATTRESADTIATGIRTITARLQRMSSQIAIEDMLGISLSENGQFIGAYEAIERISEAVRRLGISTNDVRFAKLVEELGGVRQISRVIPLITEFATAQEALNAAQNAAGSTAKDARIAQYSYAVQIQKTYESWQDLTGALANTTTFKALTVSILTVTRGLLKFIKAFKPFLPLLLTLGGIKLFKGLKGGALGRIGKKLGGLFGGGKKQETAELIATQQAQVKASEEQTKVVQDNITIITENTTAIQQLTVSVNELIAKMDGTTSGSDTPGFARGGLVPGGRSNKDTVNAKLAPGEVVMSNAAGDAYGRENLLRMNSKAAGGKIQDLADLGQKSTLLNSVIQNRSQLKKNPGDQFIARGPEPNRFNPADLVTANIKEEKFNVNELKDRAPEASEKYFKAVAADDPQERGKQFENVLAEAGIASLAKDEKGKRIGSSRMDGMFGSTPAEVKSYTSRTISRGELLKKGIASAVKGSRDGAPGAALASKLTSTELSDKADKIDLGDITLLSDATTEEFQGLREEKKDKTAKKVKAALGGLIQKFAGGGSILSTDTVGAAIMEEVGNLGPAIIPGSEIISSTLKDRKLSDEGLANMEKRLQAIFGNRSYNLVRQGLDGALGENVGGAINNRVVEMMNNLGLDLGFPGIAEGASGKFLSTLNDGVRSGIFEAVLNTIKNSGIYAVAQSASDRNDYFDFRDGLGEASRWFPSLKEISFVDAKKSLESASPTAIARKIGNEGLREAGSMSLEELSRMAEEAQSSGDIKSSLRNAMAEVYGSAAFGRGTVIPLPGTDVVGGNPGLSEKLGAIYKKLGLSDEEGNRIVKQIFGTATAAKWKGNAISLGNSKALGGFIQKLAGGGEPEEKKEKDFGEIILSNGSSSIIARYNPNSTRTGFVKAKKWKDGIWTVGLSQASKGYGPKLYDVVMEGVTDLGGMLTSDRATVSGDAKKVWQYYFKNRPDVQKTPLPRDAWTGNYAMVDKKLRGPEDTWPPTDDPAWTLQTGYRKSPSLINDPKLVKRMSGAESGPSTASMALSYFSRYANGGSVPAMVSNGEAFVPPKLAAKIGSATLEKMNKADKNGMRLASGGGISLFKGPGSGTSDSIQTELPVGGFVLREKAVKAMKLKGGGATGLIPRYSTGGEPEIITVLQAVVDSFAEEFGDGAITIKQSATEMAIALKEARDQFAKELSAERGVDKTDPTVQADAMYKALVQIREQLASKGIDTSAEVLNPEEWIDAADKFEAVVSQLEEVVGSSVRGRAETQIDTVLEGVVDSFAAEFGEGAITVKQSAIAMAMALKEARDRFAEDFSAERGVDKADPIVQADAMYKALEQIREQLESRGIDTSSAEYLNPDEWIDATDKFEAVVSHLEEVILSEGTATGSLVEQLAGVVDSMAEMGGDSVENTQADLGKFLADTIAEQMSRIASEKGVDMSGTDTYGDASRGAVETEALAAAFEIFRNHIIETTGDASLLGDVLTNFSGSMAEGSDKMQEVYQAFTEAAESAETFADKLNDAGESVDEDKKKKDKQNPNDENSVIGKINKYAKRLAGVIGIVSGVVEDIYGGEMDPTTAGALGAAKGGAAGFMTGASIAGELGLGPVGQLITGAVVGVVGAMKGFVDGFTKASVDQKLRDLAEAAVKVEKGFEGLESNVAGSEQMIVEGFGEAQSTLKDLEKISQGGTFGERLYNTYITPLTGEGTAADASRSGGMNAAAEFFAGTGEVTQEFGALSGALNTLYAITQPLGNILLEWMFTNDEAVMAARDAIARTSAKQFESAIKMAEYKGVNAAEGDTESGKIENLYFESLLEQEKKLGPVTDQRVAQIKQQASEEAALAAYRKEGIDLGRDATAVEKEISSNRQAALEQGRAIVEREQKLLDARVAQERASKIVNIALANQTDIWRNMTSALERVNTELERSTVLLDEFVDLNQGATVDRSGESVISNIGAYSKDEVLRATAPVAAAFGGGEQILKLQDQAQTAQFLEKKLPAVLRNAGSDPNAARVAINDLKTELAASGVNVEDGSVSEIFQQIAQKIDAAAVGTLLEDIDFGGIIGDFSKTIQDGQDVLLKSIQTYNNLLQRTIDLQDKFNQSLNRASDYLTKAAQVTADATVRFNDAVGRETSLEDLNKSFEFGIQNLASNLVTQGALDPAKVLDPTAIREGIESLGNRNEEIDQRNKDIVEQQKTKRELQSAETDPAKRAQYETEIGDLEQERRDNLTQIRDNTNAMQRGKEALVELASSTQRADNALKKFEESQRKVAAAADYAEKAFTSSPQENFQRAGQAAIANQALKGNTAVLRTQVGREAAFSGLEQFRGMMSEADYNSRRADLLEASFAATGQSLDATAGPTGKTWREILNQMRNPEESPEAKAYFAATKAQSQANVELAKLELRASERIAEEIISVQNEIKNLPMSFEQAVINALANQDAQSGKAKADADVARAQANLQTAQQELDAANAEVAAMSDPYEARHKAKEDYMAANAEVQSLSQRAFSGDKEAIKKLDEAKARKADAEKRYKEADEAARSMTPERKKEILERKKQAQKDYDAAQADVDVTQEIKAEADRKALEEKKALELRQQQEADRQGRLAADTEARNAQATAQMNQEVQRVEQGVNNGVPVAPSVGTPQRGAPIPPVGTSQRGEARPPVTWADLEARGASFGWNGEPQSVGGVGRRERAGQGQRPPPLPVSAADRAEAATIPTGPMPDDPAAGLRAAQSRGRANPPQTVQTEQTRRQEQAGPQEEQVVTFETSVAQFGDYVERLINFKFPTLPSTITLEATHNVNVQFQGEAMFASLEPRMRDLAISETDKAMEGLWNDSDGQYGYVSRSRSSSNGGGATA